MSRVIVCGSRTWTDRAPIAAVIAGLGPDITVVHGGCRGADMLAAHHATAAELHLADWDKYGKKAGPIRNQQMADLGADLCVAFSDQPITPGTRDMITRAKQAGIPVWVVGHG